MLNRGARPRTALLLTGAIVIVGAGVTTAAANGPTYVRPGAPGEPTQVIDPASLTESVAFSYTDADVAFFQDMIPHHGQALLMSSWAPERAESEEVRRLAERIELGQSAEIDAMQNWLAARGEDVPDADDAHDGHDGEMPGMLTGAELDALETADGAEFDVLFLESMIPHHRGAITMVGRLGDDPDAGFEPTIAALASEIESGQRAEIARMEALLDELRDE
jgi:uncharacterized protein (DUF305 family)